MTRTATKVLHMKELKLEVKDPWDSGSYVDLGGSKEGYKISGSDSGDEDVYDEEPEPVDIPLGTTTETLVVELAETSAAIQALATPGATVSGNTVTHGGRKDRRVVSIKATATDRRGGSIVLEWICAAVMTQAEMQWSCKKPNTIAIGFRKLLDLSGYTSTTVHTPAA